jgi:hypothetical protein
MANGGTVSHGTGYCAPVPLPSRVTVTGREGAIEVVNDTKLTLRFFAYTTLMVIEDHTCKHGGPEPQPSDQPIAYSPPVRFRPWQLPVGTPGK